MFKTLFCQEIKKNLIHILLRNYRISRYIDFKAY